MESIENTASNIEGVEKVLEGEGNYVFAMEAASAEYHAARNNCKLTILGGLLDSKGYGIVMQKGYYCHICLSLCLLLFKCTTTTILR
jgi:hypothetical protein